MIGADVRTVVFDCDGVIFDSNNVKSDTFAEVIAAEPPEAVGAFLTFHAENGGVSRYEKFNWFYRDYLRRHNWEEASKHASAEFSRKVRTGLLEAPLVPGVIDTLIALKHRGTTCFVVSGGAHDEVNWVISERGLKPYFLEVLGSPMSKIEHLARLEQSSALIRPGVFIGDARSDFQAAKAYGLEFIFVGGFTLWKDGENISRQNGSQAIWDFTGLRCAP